MSVLDTKRSALDAIDRAYDILADMPYAEQRKNGILEVFDLLDQEIDRRMAELRAIELAAIREAS